MVRRDDTVSAHDRFFFRNENRDSGWWGVLMLLKLSIQIVSVVLKRISLILTVSFGWEKKEGENRDRSQGSSRRGRMRP